MLPMLLILCHRGFTETIRHHYKKNYARVTNLGQFLCVIVLIVSRSSRVKSSPGVDWDCQFHPSFSDRVFRYK